jgi:hypothetical protein
LWWDLKYQHYCSGIHHWSEFKLKCTLHSETLIDKFMWWNHSGFPILDIIFLSARVFWYFNIYFPMPFFLTILLYLWFSNLRPLRCCLLVSCQSSSKSHSIHADLN